MRRIMPWLAVGLAAAALLARAPRAAALQGPPVAVIVEPAQGAVLIGLVTVSGTAAHPDFVAYDLAFAYDPDPTETWFPLGPPVNTPVVSGPLAVWDTASISDGTYRLRLRVWLSDGMSLETVVGRLQVRNETPTPIPQITARPSPAPTATAALLPPTVAAPGHGGSPFAGVATAFLFGAAAAVMGLLGLAAYLSLGSNLSQRWTNIRRRLPRRSPHQRRRSRRRRP